MKITVALVTYKRPEYLAVSLSALSRLRFCEGRGMALSVLIVDNDVTESARSVVEEARGNFPWVLEYEVEARRGIPFGRNRCVVHALASGARWLAFIDDDEEPEPFWLERLLEGAERYHADVVTGPVLPKFSVPPPVWMTDGHFFDRRRYPSGTVLKTAATNNVLVSTEIFCRLSPWFDERLAFNGGSDSRFFVRAASAGAKIVWVDEAPVWETIPRSRMRVPWLLRRMYRVGISRASTRLDQMSFLKAVGLTLGSAMVWTGKGIGFLSISLFLPSWKAVALRGLRHLCYAGGQLSSLIGGSYEEYR